MASAPTTSTTLNSDSTDAGSSDGGNDGGNVNTAPADTPRNIVHYIFDSDLLSTKYSFDAIAHQCSCYGRFGGGLYASMIKEFTYSDVYTDRIRNSTPGTIVRCVAPDDPIIHVGCKWPDIICMMSQALPGSSRHPSDLPAQRLVWFKKCLDKIAFEPNLESVAFPYLIGCDIGGGEWALYKNALDQWAARRGRHLDVFVVSNKPRPSDHV